MGGGGTPGGGAGRGGGGTATAGWAGGGGGGGGGSGGGMGKPGCGGGGGGGSGGKPGGGGSGRLGASTLGAATAAAPGVTTMGLGQSALVMGAEGISSSEISMSSPEDWWPSSIFSEVGVLSPPRSKATSAVWPTRPEGSGGPGSGGGRGPRHRSSSSSSSDSGSGVGLMSSRPVLEGGEEGGEGPLKPSWELAPKAASGESWEEEEEMGLPSICSSGSESCSRRKGSLVRCSFKSISMRESRLS